MKIEKLPSLMENVIEVNASNFVLCKLKNRVTLNILVPAAQESFA